MSLRGPYLATGKQVIRGLCVYELVALHSNLPTVTRLCHQHRKCWVGRVVMSVGLGWLFYHLAFEPDEMTGVTVTSPR